MQIAFLVLLFVLGACFGSFLCCQARRLHRKAQGKKPLGSRSVCNYCHHQLSWYDNIPLVSWCILKGRCRRCHRKIGLTEPLSELGLAAAFLALGTTIDFGVPALSWAIFITVLIFTIILAFLAIYDGLYGELPVPFLTASLIIACLLLVLRTCATLSSAPFAADLIWRPLLAVFILGGLYLALYLLSHGKWVGDGDWLLGAAIAIALADPMLALVTLFLANFIACLIMAPSTLRHKNHRIHFGPFLAIAFVITYSLAPVLQSILQI